MSVLHHMHRHRHISLLSFHCKSIHPILTQSRGTQILSYFAVSHKSLTSNNVFPPQQRYSAFTALPSKVLHLYLKQNLAPFDFCSAVCRYFTFYYFFLFFLFREI
eukprot:c4435_g1_i2.p1 GENE.c4435_g1_i2~~c4435_g1_i2.p1  ORF type:complete len:105 (+),score=4.40 c4435_g1_i2:178-492(+)